VTQSHTSELALSTDALSYSTTLLTTTLQTDSFDLLLDIILDDFLNLYTSNLFTTLTTEHLLHEHLFD
jgi:hypothetical protein